MGRQMLELKSVIDFFKEIKDYWSPKIIAEVNDEYVKLAKFKGELVLHDHKNSDEMFYVVKGSFDLHLENKIIHLNEGDFYVVKKGIQHKPVSEEESWIMMIEKKETKHTGDVVYDITKTIDEQLK
jgi:mannose-6-phosphate isomerase-like protein (cupin superfamily)